MPFDEELAAFRARTPDPGFQALIVLGTERHNITAALLLGTLKLRRVAFLTTPETRDFPQYIASLIGVDGATWECPTTDHSITTAVYESVKALRLAWSDITDPAMIAVDVTGGRKPMSVGLEKAGHILGMTTIYVESDYWAPDSGKRGVIPGTQRLVIPPNPYTVFGDLEADEAKRLYRAHDYAGAQRIFESLSGRVTGEQRYIAWAELSAVYAAWDVLDLRSAIVAAQSLHARRSADPQLFGGAADRLDAQIGTLQKLQATVAMVTGRDQQALDTLADPAAILALLGTLHTAAYRRAAQGRYDFAALFRYRCLELISQHRLATYGILTNSPEYELLQHVPDHLQTHVQPTLRAALSLAFQEQQRLVGRKQPTGLPKNSITLFDGYLILAALADPLLTDLHLKRIEDRTKARNLSVLAHGYNLIGEQEYQDFAEIVDEIIDRLFERVLGKPRSDWEAAAQFINPF